MKAARAHKVNHALLLLLKSVTPMHIGGAGKGKGKVAPVLFN